MNDTRLHVRPTDIMPAGIDSDDQLAEYFVRLYAFAICDPEQAAIALF